jgi:hypothetical protein
LPVTIAFAAPAGGQVAFSDGLDSLLEDADELILPSAKAAIGPVSQWLASKLDGFEVSSEHVTFHKSPAKALLSATGDRVLVVLPGQKSLMADAKAAREAGIRVIDALTGEDLVLAGEVAPLPQSLPSLDGLRKLNDEELVEAGRQVAHGSQWFIAALSNEWVRRYDDTTLADFADRIGVAHQTIRTWRSVFTAWKDFPGFTGLRFSIAQELAPREDRFELIKADPAMTAREARALAREATPARTGRPRQVENLRPADPTISVRPVNIDPDDDTRPVGEALATPLGGAEPLADEPQEPTPATAQAVVSEAVSEPQDDAEGTSEERVLSGPVITVPAAKRALDEALALAEALEGSQVTDAVADSIARQLAAIRRSIQG